MNIPVKALKEISRKYGYDHIICFATKGKMQYVATYGTTIQACDEAAQFGDKMKDGLGWPESLHAAPSRVRALQKRVKELEAQLASHLTPRALDVCPSCNGSGEGGEIGLRYKCVACGGTCKRQ